MSVGYAVVTLVTGFFAVRTDWYRVVVGQTHTHAQTYPERVVCRSISFSEICTCTSPPIGLSWRNKLFSGTKRISLSLVVIRTALGLNQTMTHTWRKGWVTSAAITKTQDDAG